jgi:hypothetical protein
MCSIWEVNVEKGEDNDRGSEKRIRNRVY